MASQFFSGSTRETCTLSTFSRLDPALASDSFMMVNASAVCSLISPALGRRSGYQPPMPLRKRRWPDRIGPPALCFLGVQSDFDCASNAPAPAPPIRVARSKVLLASDLFFGSIATCYTKTGLNLLWLARGYKCC